MKNARLLALIPILFLTVFFMNRVEGYGIAIKSVAAAEVKTIKKPLSAFENKSSGIKPPAVKQQEIKPPVLAPLADPVNRNAVGCIFPLTGRFADAGNKALDAVLLSAKIFNQRSVSPWKIVVADSGETPEGIKEAVACLADAKVIAIIVIAGTAEANVAAIEAQRRQVPLILIASKEGVTEIGEYVFQHFLTPTQQIQALTKYAFDTFNIAIFSVLYPQDDYGEEMVRLFRNEIKKAGGKIDQAIPYGKRQTDFTEQIKKLTGNKFGVSEKVHTATEESQGKLSVGFEALFIPDSPLRVKMIASQLAFYDVKAVRLLGTSLWHSSDLLKKGAEYLEGAVFADSFLVNGILPETNDFVDIYYSAYSRDPGTIDALSYDTMGLVLGVLENGEIKTRAEFIKALSAVQGFRGVTGTISFHGSRVAQKDAFILKVQNGKIEQVK
ncbi:MAG: hypothetical protein CVU71_14975 [Deltaproteobacteria bacterium HGW-Deltaproteobacteria-6]|jgi:ABC-type branched-subunit amino acid transport system substrate-binding protein|nr:MAG: hypothetical protein CVU71_14975 [Deltaproteobacteria bacterium HGW-Deltaproteobacteria-6]